jgi:kinetochor protein Mis14/NSL1
MDSAAHRPIELQSPEDFIYLIDNVRRAAAENINEAFPPVEDGQEEDELRNRIEQLVNDVRILLFIKLSSSPMNSN